MKDTLIRYESLFSAGASLIYLPAFFIDRHSDAVETRFATEIHSHRSSGEARRATKILGSNELPLYRTVFCLAANKRDDIKDSQIVEPPDLEFETTGFWRPLSHMEVGQDRDGNPVVGKTWVERTESWSSKGMDKFVISLAKQDQIEGPDPGKIYIMRSGSHTNDLYKIGLTRRETSKRSKEVSSATGVPTKFEVLAEWEVGDCTAVEQMVHQHLQAYRVNKRREFFKVSLSKAIESVNKIIHSIDRNGDTHH